MPGEMALLIETEAFNMPYRAGGLEDQPYALLDAFIIIRAERRRFQEERTRVEKGS